MSNIEPVDIEKTEGATKSQLKGIEKKLGRVPNLLKGLANSPAALNGYVAFSGALAAGVLPAQLRERIALAVAEANQCAYCLAAHSAIGKSVGLTAEEIRESRAGVPADTRTYAVLEFVRDVVERRGLISQDSLAALRDGGFDDGEITEIVANVALNLFTNYFNHIADTPVDFPAAEPLHAGAR